jgi:hypothetical protein
MQLFIFNINVGIVKSISATLGFLGWQHPVQDIPLVTKTCHKHERTLRSTDEYVDLTKGIKPG